jgi:hypothetical protein
MLQRKRVTEGIDEGDEFSIRLFYFLDSKRI